MKNKKITTSLLTAGGCEPQLEVHINGSLNVGIAPEKRKKPKDYAKNRFVKSKG